MRESSNSNGSSDLSNSSDSSLPPVPGTRNPVPDGSFPVTVTPEAIAHFKKVRERKGEPEAMLRVGVKGGGCSGLEYMMKVESSRKETDLSTEVEGVTILCDPKSAAFLAGSNLVYTGNLMSGGGFQFENPNAARSCGCGTSFTPKR